MTTAEKIAALLLILGVAAVILRVRPDPPLATRRSCSPGHTFTAVWVPAVFVHRDPAGASGAVGVILTYGSNQQRGLDTVARNMLPRPVDSEMVGERAP